MSEEDRLGPVAKHVAERVGEARAHARLTQQQVVDRLAEQGLSMLKTTLSKVENSQRGIAVDELVALATALNVSVLDLLPPECATRPRNGSGARDELARLRRDLARVAEHLGVELLEDDR